jgi:hypothetical protein
MKLHEQRTELATAAEQAAQTISGMRAMIRRKVMAPYGDGSRSDMINANTDVLPLLAQLEHDLTETLDRCSR